MTRALLIYHSVSALFSLLLLLTLYRIRKDRAKERFLLLGCFQLCLLILAAILFPLNGFGRLQLLAWGVFLYFPIYLAAGSALYYRRDPALSITSSVLLSVMLIVVLDAFLIEPYWLQPTQIELQSEKLQEPLIVAFLADIQTDSPAEYERRALQLVASYDPDLVLYGGDYLQVSDPDHYQDAAQELNKLIRDVDLNPHLGSYAVRGNVDWNIWQEIFQELDVIPIESTTTLQVGPLTLTGLDLLDSDNINLEVPGSESYHLVLGHSPNFSLGEIDADLLLAGHTHGGQVQLPGIGPLLTLSAVPREWASGLTEIGPEKVLFVSRGVGLERGDAPRMRFFCRPEVVILTLVPEP